MDVHTPKAIHGWRELLQEIGTIVLGVLIALGAEQAVQAIHWRYQVAQGRDSIRAELESAAYNATERVLFADCLENRINFLQASLERSGGVWKPQPWSIVAKDPLAKGQAYMAPIRNWDSAVWKSLIADGTALHFPREELLMLARAYQVVDNLGATNNDERRNGARILMMGRAFELGATAKYEAQTTLEDQRSYNRFLALASRQLLADIKGAGLAPRGKDWDAEVASINARVANCTREAAAEAAALEAGT